MSVLEIITLDKDKEKILTKVAEEVKPEEISDLQVLINDMIETCHAYDALGLAAPQIGVSKRIFVLEDGTVCINPKVAAKSGKITSHREGCLSVGTRHRYDKKRFRNLIVEGWDRDGKTQRIKPRRKLQAIAVQHEIDHLNGKLVCDE
jgi:peptide deformylase